MFVNTKKLTCSNFEMIRILVLGGKIRCLLVATDWLRTLRYPAVRWSNSSSVIKRVAPPFKKKKGSSMIIVECTTKYYGS